MFRDNIDRVIVATRSVLDRRLLSSRFSRKEEKDKGTFATGIIGLRRDFAETLKVPLISRRSIENSLRVVT